MRPKVQAKAKLKTKVKCKPLSHGKKASWLNKPSARGIAGADASADAGADADTSVGVQAGALLEAVDSRWLIKRLAMR